MKRNILIVLLLLIISVIYAEKNGFPHRYTGPKEGLEIHGPKDSYKIKCVITEGPRGRY